MSSPYSPLRGPHILKKGKTLKFKDLEGKTGFKELRKNHTFSAKMPNLQNIMNSSNNLNQILARVWLKLAKISSFFGLERDHSQHLRKTPSVFNNFTNLLKEGEEDLQLLMGNFLLTLNLHTKKLEEINEKIQPKVLTEDRIKTLEKNLVEIQFAIRQLGG